MGANEKIRIQNLDLYYGEFHALKNINLEIREKQITSFIGPSGCGKSTLLKLMTKIITPVTRSAISIVVIRLIGLLSQILISNPWLLFAITRSCGFFCFLCVILSSPSLQRHYIRKGTSTAF